MSVPDEEAEALLRPPPEPSSFIGSVVGHRYRVEKLIGRGGMGAVFLAEHTELGTPVALKVLIAERGVAPEDVERFMREARAAVQIGHRNIVRVFDLGRTDDGLPYMAMERLEGEDLDQLLVREGKLDPERTLAILAPIASAIDAVHTEGLVHRDIKPANVFLSQEKGEIVPKLLDFGLAQLRDRSAEERLTGTGMIVGTPHYMAPEVGTGSDPDEWSDQYSLAVVAYELLFGQLPFDGTNPTAIMMAKSSEDPPRLPNARVNDQLWAALARGLAREPSERFESCTALVRALAEGWSHGAAPARVSREALTRDDMRGAEALDTRVLRERRERETEAAPTMAAPKSAGVSEPPVTLPMRRGSRRLVALAAVVALLGVGLVLWAPWRSSGTPTPTAPETPEREVTADPQNEEPENAAPEPVEEPSNEALTQAPAPTLVPSRDEAAPEEAAPEEDSRTRRSAMRAVPAEPTEADTQESAPPTVTEMEEPARSPERAAELTALGQRALLRGRLPQAARFFREATYSDSRHAPAWRGLGISEERMNHAPEARRAYRRYLRLAPGAGDAAAIRRRMNAL